LLKVECLAIYTCVTRTDSRQTPKKTRLSGDAGRAEHRLEARSWYKQKWLPVKDIDAFDALKDEFKHNLDSLSPKH